MLLRQGSRGREVIELQQALGIADDGVFGAGTKQAVEAYQKEHGLMVDGIVGSQTLAAIRENHATTDNSERVYAATEDLLVHKYFLPKGEYLAGPTAKAYLFLHHTAGWHNPYHTVDGWAKDNRGTIATEFVLGGRSVKGNDDRYDGELLQCVPEGGYGWHLGKNGSQHMHTHSAAIEVCNFSYAKGGKTYVGTPIVADQIVTLAKPFRGHRQWHAYSDKQIETLKAFILWIAERDSIDVRAGLVAAIKQKGAQAFEYNAQAYNGKIKGMWTHGNIRKDKFDLFPQADLIDMLLSL
ncbi:MAG: peptidoglycan-binding domain-containing protein [Mariprofundus sp.]|nr:peptidoglycan-binding domain-containing protein [Mariprofundus sp.]